MSKLDLPGQAITRLDKRKISIIMYVQGGVFFVAGVVAILFGRWEGLAAIFSLGLLWMGKSLGTTRLEVTSEGVYYIRGKGFNQQPVVHDSATWDEIESVALVTRKTGSGSKSSTSHTMEFTRKAGDKKLKYLIGFVQADRVALLAKAAKQRGISIST